MIKYWQEFKSFAIKGNVIDLAVAVIIGAAFGKIVSSLVSDVIMPLVSVIVGGVDFTTWKWILKKEITSNGIITNAAVVMNIGSFLQNIFDFLIISLAIFLMIKMISKIKSRLATEEKQAEEKKDIQQSSAEQKLLVEIRDILKEKL